MRKLLGMGALAAVLAAGPAAAQGTAEETREAARAAGEDAERGARKAGEEAKEAGQSAERSAERTADDAQRSAERQADQSQGTASGSTSGQDSPSQQGSTGSGPQTSRQEKQRNMWEGEEKFELKGKVSKASSSSITVTRESLPSATLQVSKQTKIELDGEQASAQQLKPGQEVQASFNLQGDKPVAIEIKAEK